ncbi:MAG: DUF2235 domain-containing protein [Candidatus Methylomirabilales bacterium]
MERNIVICSDGTGNTFDKSVSNVTRLIKLLALDKSQEQIVVYDQGIGTNARRLDAVKDYHKSIPDKDSLIILDGPKAWRFAPVGRLASLLGLAIGYGFKANVREMYKILSQLYEGPDDKIYLFGFSRGAFTVRALAGLLYRCGLPGKNVGEDEKKFKACFGEAYDLFKPILYEPIREKIANKILAFRDKYSVRDCTITIHFLGVWDTVKSYGGVWPKLLPHLRHNPHVKIMRHALALNERRSWFNATTWGRLDLDDKGAALRLTKTELDELKKQGIEEVWFRGCHSDIGGGDAEANTAKIALRWMLGEAAAARVRLNDDGKMMLKDDDPPGPVEIHESLRGLWWLTEYLPRWEIDNSGKYPVRKFKWRRTGRRNPDDLTRNGKILLHTRVGNLHSISVPVEYWPTKV